MSMTSPIPKTLDGVKRLARRFKASDGLTHARALDKAAVIAGHPNFKSMKRTLDAQALAESASAPSMSRKGPTTMRDQFRAKNTAAWEAAITPLGVDPGQSESWTGLSAITRVLDPVMGLNLNHSLLPGGGGLDFEAVGPSREPGCLEFTIGERVAYIGRPKVLTFERLADKGESFFLLELDRLEPSGVYARNDGDDDDDEDRPRSSRRVRESEELVELYPGDYVSRSVWDRGFLRYAEDGSEIPLPDSARLANRWFKGKVLIVAKSSLWNSAAETYDGRHSQMTAAQIREVIEASLEPDE